MTDEVPKISIFGEVVGLYAGRKLIGFKYEPTYLLHLRMRANNSIGPGYSAPLNEIEIKEFLITEEMYNKTKALLEASKAQAPRIELIGKLELAVRGTCIN